MINSKTHTKTPASAGLLLFFHGKFPKILTHHFGWKLAFLEIGSKDVADQYVMKPSDDL